jgi:hypothetical protein
MPRISFDALPPSARVWVFGSAAPVSGAARDALFAAVDDHLIKWKAHGTPLVCARDWRDDRFLAVAVDEAATGASGCSIDGLFRVLARIEPELGTSLVGSGMIFWREPDGTVRSATRSEFTTAGKAGTVQLDTPVFDTTVNTVGAWRNQFELPATDTWHAKLLARAT